MGMARDEMWTWAARILLRRLEESAAFTKGSRGWLTSLLNFVG